MGCPYYLSNSLKKTADIIFAPYAYALVKDSMVDLKKS